MTDTIESLRAELAEVERERDLLFDSLNLHMRSTGITDAAMERVETFRAVIAASTPQVRGEIVRLEKGWQAAADRAKEAERERDAARAEADVRSGRWCEKNRAEGRDGCGMCAWCCKWQRERADTALAACAEMRAVLEGVLSEHEARVGECNCGICYPIHALLKKGGG